MKYYIAVGTVFPTTDWIMKGLKVALGAGILQHSVGLAPVMSSTGIKEGFDSISEGYSGL